MTQQKHFYVTTKINILSHSVSILMKVKCKSSGVNKWWCFETTNPHLCTTSASHSTEDKLMIWQKQQKNMYGLLRKGITRFHTLNKQQQIPPMNQVLLLFPHHPNLKQITSELKKKCVIFYKYLNKQISENWVDIWNPFPFSVESLVPVWFPGTQMSPSAGVDSFCNLRW